MDYCIEFYYNKTIDSVFIHKLFYFLISRGVKYNAYRHKASYIISPENDKHISYMESEIKESTEKIALILQDYLKFCAKTTNLIIDLDYMCEVNFNFTLHVIPYKDGTCSLIFESGEYRIADEKTFLVFINLCKDVFNKLDFSHGAFKVGHDQSYIPSNGEKFLKEEPSIVNFYSKTLVAKLGHETLLSVPALKVEELENGGVMVLICTNVRGCPDDISKARIHLHQDIPQATDN